MGLFAYAAYILHRVKMLHLYAIKSSRLSKMPVTVQMDGGTLLITSGKDEAIMLSDSLDFCQLPLIAFPLFLQKNGFRHAASLIRCLIEKKLPSTRVHVDISHAYI